MYEDVVLRRCSLWVGGRVFRSCGSGFGINETRGVLGRF